VIGFGLSQAIRLISNMIMTRLLAPEMFGIIAIAYMLMAGLTLMSDVGIRPSIIRSKHADDPLFLNTAWLTQIGKGVVVAIAGLVISRGLHLANLGGLVPASSTYADPVLPLVVAIIASVEALAGFESTKVATANRSLSLGRVALMELSSQIIGMICMILWALWNPSIWALVCGGVTGRLSRTVISHLAIPGLRNGFTWSKVYFWEILSFGKWVILSSTLTFAADSGDRLMLASVLDPKQLGIYAIAYLIINGIQQVLSRIVSNVAFAALSETIRLRPEKLADIYYKFRLPIDAFGLFVSGFLFVAGGEVVRLLFDTRYAEAGEMVQILSVSLIATRYFATEFCLLALGRSALVSAATVTRVVALFLGIPIAFSLFGVKGAIWAIALSPFASLPVTFYFQNTYKFLRLTSELRFLVLYAVGMGAGWTARLLEMGSWFHK
jgi:O-antigen/teichoic acid export membrane protein